MTSHGLDWDPLVIILSGTSSSGKSSLAKVLQRRLSLPAVLIEADRTFPVMPSPHPAWLTSSPFGVGAALAFHRSVATWAECGFHVIVDGSLPYENRRLRDACLRVFEAFDVRLVGVRCSVDELTMREEQRPDKRPSGWAARQARDIHNGLHYAAEVDTTDRSPDDCVEDLVSQLGLPLLA